MGERGKLLRSGEVAKRFGVSPKTVARWAAQGKVIAYLTPGKHRRYFEGDIQNILRAEHTELAKENA